MRQDYTNLLLIASSMVFIFFIIILLDITNFHRDFVDELRNKEIYNILATQNNNKIHIKKVDLHGVIREETIYTLDEKDNVVAANNNVYFITKLDAFRYKNRYNEAFSVNAKLDGSTLTYEIPSKFKDKNEIVEYVNNFENEIKPIAINEIK